MISHSFLKQLDNTFQALGKGIYIKDKQLRYHYINNHALETLHYEQENCLERKDYELQFGRHAQNYLEHDNACLKGQVYHQLDAVPDYNGELFYALSQKLPFKNEDGQIIGILGFSEYFTPQQAVKEIFNQRAIEEKKIKIKIDKMELIQKVTHLTPKELLVAAELFKGRSAKQIARNFAVSARTVEFHTENIKKKWQCSTKADLLDYAHANGFIHFSFLWESLIEIKSIHSV